MLYLVQNERETKVPNHCTFYLLYKLKKVEITNTATQAATYS